MRMRIVLARADQGIETLTTTHHSRSQRERHPSCMRKVSQKKEKGGKSNNYGVQYARSLVCIIKYYRYFNLYLNLYPN